jgi:lysine-specific demethylase/histidyl-hydroxylase NO66
MATLDELLHPITTAQFFADYEGRKPLHIPAETGGRKREVLTWAAMNAILGQSTTWTPQNLRLMRNHVAIPPEQYCDPFLGVGSQTLRATPAKIETFLSAGASLVANDVLYLHPPLTEIGRTLSETFAAQIGANIYCSFEGVRAFGTHFDNHDVLVVHTEGEKVWNLYANQALNPVNLPPDTMETRRWFEQSRGPLMSEVTMRPGDVLYLPRGWYHDAVASDRASLHVTFSIHPLYGRILLSLLDNAAMQNPDFRAWLPPGRAEGGAPLRRKLAELGQLLADLVASPAFLDEVTMAQQRLAPRPAAYALPERKPVTLYRTTGHAFPPASTGLRVAYDWAIQEREFSLEAMLALFDFLPAAEVQAGVAEAERVGAVKRV